MFFENELNELVFDNVLQAEIIFLLMDKEFDKEQIILECKELKNHYDLFRFVDSNLANSFNKIIERDLEKKIDDILSGLKKEEVVRRAKFGSRKLVTNFSLDIIKKKNITRITI